MKTSKKKWLSRALSCALAVTLTAGTAVMTPVADIVGTNITANAENDYSGYNEWTDTGINEKGEEAQVTCYWKVEDGTLCIAGIIPNTNNATPAWCNLWSSITQVYVEANTRTSADAAMLFYTLSNVTSMDLSNLDTSAATNMSYMFCSCSMLETIYVGSGWSTDNLAALYSDTYMFLSCSKLVGGAGTKYDDSKVDKTYARIDGGTSAPGYLTQKEETAVQTYTVTWKNEGGTPISTSEVTAGTAPVYNGDTPTKTTADNKKYAFTGWTDGTNTYGLNDTLPAVTGDVAYTAVFEEYDKDFARDVGYFVGDKINFGDTYIKDYIWQNAKTYHISGVYTLVSAVYDSNKRYYIATLQSRNETIQLITNGYSDMGEQIAFVASSGVGTSSQPYQFQMKKYGTVIWKDEDGNVVETDEKVLDDTRPSYDGEALTKESEEPDKYHYVLRWSKDNTNDPYEYDQLFDVSFRDTDTVTYNAVFLKAQYVAENGVYFIGDTIDFNGKYVKMEDSGGVGVVNSIKTIQNIRLYNASTGRYQVALHQSRSTGYFYFTVGENYGSKVAYVVKSGTGTQDDPYIMGIAPYFTVTWKNGEDIIETDEKVIEGDAPTYDGETPEKDSNENYVYTFKGWTSDGGETVYTADDTFPAVSENITYTAVYDEFAVIHEDDIFVNNTESTPKVFVTDCRTGDILTAGTDYTLEIADGTVTVKGIGTYTGEVEKSFTVLSREMKASITNRRKAGSNAKATLSGEWYLPKNATNIKAGIARLSTDDTDVTNYDVYNNGVKKASSLKTTSGKYSFSLTLNSTHANQNLYAVTYVTYEIDGVPYVSISKMSESIVNYLA